jgi:O-antigen ligase
MKEALRYTPQLPDFSVRELLLFASTVGALFLFLLVRLEAVAMFVIPGVALGFLSIVLLFQFPRLLILAYLFLTPLILEPVEGITPLEALFLGYSILCILVFTVIPAMRLSLPLETTLDKTFLFLLFLLPAGSILGVLNGAQLYSAIGELTYYAAAPLYFGFRWYLGNKEHSLRRKDLLHFAGILIFVLLFVMARNAFNYQQLLVQAYLEWQVEKARVAANEVLILLSSVLITVAVLHLKTFKGRILMLGLLGISVGSLILTQSRGYWLAYAFSFFIIFLLEDRSKKLRMLLYFGATFTLLLAIALTFFEDYVVLISIALAERFSSIFSSSTLFSSLQDRLAESQTVLGKILDNPIAGYGLGVEFIRFYFFENYHLLTSYVHNGYLAVWYKFGISGLFVFLGIAFQILKKGFRLFRLSRYATNSDSAVNSVESTQTISTLIPLKIQTILSLSIVSLMSGMLLVNITSPQFLAFDSILLMTIMAAFLSSMEISLNDREPRMR